MGQFLPVEWRFAQMVLLLLVVCGGTGRAEGRGSKGEAELTVAVAANARPALEELAREFTRETSIAVTLSTGSSGALARQAREGAPFDLFVSADMERLETLVRAGEVSAASVAPYARGVLVLWQPDRASPRLGALDELSSLPVSRMRLALANPAHAPYGAAARMALERQGLWDDVDGRMVFGEDVGQVLQMARSGNVDAAFLPLSLVKGRADGTWIALPEELHPPILQGVGVMARSASVAEAHQFRDYLLSGKAAEVFRRHGYRLAKP